MFLDLDIPDDDPLRPAKIFVSTAAPGFRIFEKSGNIDWESDFIWLVIVNEEDGLDFKIRQTIDGKREIQALWKDDNLDDTSKLRDYLHGDPLWDVYQLRATVLLQGRVELQIETLKEVGNPEREVSTREAPWSLAKRLRKLELVMLERAMEALEDQVRSTLLYPAFSSCATAKPYAERSTFVFPLHMQYRLQAFMGSPFLLVQACCIAKQRGQDCVCCGVDCSNAPWYLVL